MNVLFCFQEVAGGESSNREQMVPEVTISLNPEQVLPRYLDCLTPEDMKYQRIPMLVTNKPPLVCVELPPGLNVDEIPLPEFSVQVSNITESQCW